MVAGSCLESKDDLNVITRVERNVTAVRLKTYTKRSLRLYKTVYIKSDLPAVAACKLEVRSILMTCTSISIYILVTIYCKFHSLVADTTLEHEFTRNENDLRELKILCLVKVKNDVIKTCLVHTHCGSLRAFYKLAFSDHDVRIVCIGCLVFSCLKVNILKVCAVTERHTSLIKGKIEILSLLKDDIFLVHTVTSCLCHLVESGCHHELCLKII